MVRCFRDEIDNSLEDLDIKMSGSFFVVIGILVYEEIVEVSKKIKSKNFKIKLDVYLIINNYFGDMIIIVGFLIGIDIID